MSQRLESVDLFRLIAIIAVIVIHTTPFGPDVVGDSTPYKALDALLDQSSRFAVPFFFAISGYFWGVKVHRDSAPLVAAAQTARRVLTVLLAWSLIYLLPFDLRWLFDASAPGPQAQMTMQFDALAASPQSLLVHGTKLHLWYLIALLCALGLSAGLITIRQPTLLVALAVLLYAVGLAGKSYSETPLGLALGFDTRNGPFGSTLLFVAGHALSAQTPTARWAVRGALLFVAGYLLHVTEIAVLWQAFGRGPKAHDYTIGTALMGFGFAMAALSNHPRLRLPRLARFGQMTLGIYAGHFVFVDLLAPIDRLTDHPLWELSYVALVLLLSTAMTAWLARFRLTRPIVI